jgi:hypothetical protein
MFQTIAITRAKKSHRGGLPVLSEKEQKRGEFRKISGTHGQRKGPETQIYAAQAGKKALWLVIKGENSGSFWRRG